MKEEYYLNNNQNNCIKLPKRVSDFLLKSNYLSEFSTLEEQEQVIQNLGLFPRFQELKTLIDQKVIKSGGIVWDLVPTEGNTDHVLSSNAIYLALTKYYTQVEVDNKVQQLFNAFIENSRVDDILSNTSTNPVQNKVIKNTLDLLHQEIEALKNQEHIPAEIDEEQLEEINNRLEELQNEIDSLNTNVNNLDHVKHIFLGEEEYNALIEYAPNTLYFIVEGGDNQVFHFGDTFPIILG